MFNHDHLQDEDINIDHTHDSCGTEIYDMRQLDDQDTSQTASEHALVSLLLTSPVRTPSPPPPERAASPSPSPASAPPSQLPATRGTRHYKKSSRAKKAAPKQAKKLALKRTMIKRKGKEPVVRAAKKQKQVKWAENTAIVNNDHNDDQDDELDDELDDDHGDDHGDDCGVGHSNDDDNDENEDEDNASEHSVASETPLPMLMPAPIQHPHFLSHHVHMSPLHFVPGPDSYLHSGVAYHDLRAARDILFFQYNAAAREAVAEGEPWGFLWFNSDWMEQRAASVLIEFKRLLLAPVPVPVPVTVARTHSVVVNHPCLHPQPQPQPHDLCEGCAECYYWPKI
ncbi:hypothetical protein BG003_004838 [Podila horticola]|nr:hypothetical protein BG003_004838 [Podila horticola]